MNREYQKMVLLESNYDQLLRIKKQFGVEKAWNIFEAMCNYSFYDEEPAEDSEVWWQGFGQFHASLSNYRAKQPAITGRPSIELEMDMVLDFYCEYGTWNAVAEELGISTNTLRTKRQEWNDAVEGGDFDNFAKSLKNSKTKKEVKNSQKEVNKSQKEVKKDKKEKSFLLFEQNGNNDENGNNDAENSNATDEIGQEEEKMTIAEIDAMVEDMDKKANQTKSIEERKQLLTKAIHTEVNNYSPASMNYKWQNGKPVITDELLANNKWNI